MADQKQEKTTSIQPLSTPLDCTDKLSHIQAQVAFIMHTISGGCDWIAPSAATGLYYTLEGIHDGIEEVSESIHPGGEA